METGEHPDPQLRRMPFGPLLAFWMDEGVGLPTDKEASRGWSANALIRAMTNVQDGKLLDSRFGSDSTLRKYKNGDSFPSGNPWVALREALTENLPDTVRAAWFDLLTSAWTAAKSLNPEERKNLYSKAYSHQFPHQVITLESNDGKDRAGIETKGLILSLSDLQKTKEEKLITRKDTIVFEGIILKNLQDSELRSMIQFRLNNIDAAIQEYIRAISYSDQAHWKEHVISRAWNAVCNLVDESDDFENAIQLVSTVRATFGPCNPQALRALLGKAKTFSHRTNIVDDEILLGEISSTKIIACWMMSSTSSIERAAAYQKAIEGGLAWSGFLQLWMLEAESEEERGSIYEVLSKLTSKPPMSFLLAWMHASSSPVERKRISDLISELNSELLDPLMTKWMLRSVNSEERREANAFRKRIRKKPSVNFLEAWGSRSKTFAELKSVLDEARSNSLRLGEQIYVGLIWYSEAAFSREQIVRLMRENGLTPTKRVYAAWMRSSRDAGERRKVWTQIENEPVLMSSELFSYWMSRVSTDQERQQVIDCQKKAGVMPDGSFFSFWIEKSTRKQERLAIIEELKWRKQSPLLGLFIGWVTSAQDFDERKIVYEHAKLEGYGSDEGIFAHWMASAKDQRERKHIVELWRHVFKSVSPRSEQFFGAWMNHCATYRERHRCTSILLASNIKLSSKFLAAWVSRASDLRERRRVRQIIEKNFPIVPLDIVSGLLFSSFSDIERRSIYRRAESDGLTLGIRELGSWMRKASSLSERRMIIEKVEEVGEGIDERFVCIWIRSAGNLVERKEILVYLHRREFPVTSRILQELLHCSSSYHERQWIGELAVESKVSLSSKELSCWMHQASGKVEREEVFGKCKTEGGDIHRGFWISWLKSSDSSDELVEVVSLMHELGAMMDFRLIVSAVRSGTRSVPVRFWRMLFLAKFFVERGYIADVRSGRLIGRGE